MLPIVELVRLEESDAGTFGILKINKEVFCVTLEPKDEENKQDISSIPAQQYICTRYSSAKYPDTFEVSGVPNRSFVLFHSGNTIVDTQGCILLAQHWGKLRGERAVLNSGNTFNRFLAVMKKFDMFHLTIREVY